MSDTFRAFAELYNEVVGWANANRENVRTENAAQWPTIAALLTIADMIRRHREEGKR